VLDLIFHLDLNTHSDAQSSQLFVKLSLC
jgi:hypothetical protein